MKTDEVPRNHSVEDSEVTLPAVISGPLLSQIDLRNSVTSSPLQATALQEVTVGGLYRIF